MGLWHRERERQAGGHRSVQAASPQDGGLAPRTCRGPMRGVLGRPPNRPALSHESSRETWRHTAAWHDL